MRRQSKTIGFNSTPFIGVLLLFVAFTLMALPLNCQLLHQSTESKIKVKISNKSSHGNWRMWIAQHGDTVFSGGLHKKNFEIELNRNASYHINIYQDDKPGAKSFYINGWLRDTPSVEIVCGDDGLVTNDVLLLKYSDAVFRFTSSINSIVRKPITGASSIGFAGLDSSLRVLENDVLGLYYLPVEKSYFLDSVIAPVRQYLMDVQARWKKVEELGSLDKWLSKSLTSDFHANGLDSKVPLRMSSLSSESYLMIRGIAYSMSMLLPSRISRTLKISSSPLTVDMSKVVLAILGDQCACEVAYGLLQRGFGKIGVDYSDCMEPLPVYLKILANSDSAFFCDRAKIDAIPVCNALSTKSVYSLQGRNKDLDLVTRKLSPDSVYLIHFWGTWCKPCLAVHELVNLIADTVAQLGCTTIHISYEEVKRVDVWKKFIGDQTGENYFVANDFRNRNTIVDQMAVMSFPKFMVVGKKGVILSRDVELEDAVEFVRSRMK